MTHEEFERVLETRFKVCRDTLLEKSKEYARDGDRLHNFKSAGALKGESPEKALWGMLAKHVVSVQDMVNDIEAGIDVPLMVVDEKLKDWIDYAILLEALILERKGVTSSAYL